jgi:uncharacterized membrane protein YkvI
MKRWMTTLQIAFTYIGTIVGAGFATGQEILQFFSKYGSVAIITIFISTCLFIWFGTKLMLLANSIGAKSYEDVNRYVFGAKLGRWFSLFLLFEMLAIATVMLAGAGTVFAEQLQLPFLLGIIISLLLGYFVMTRGIQGIVSVNSIVVPCMMIFSIIVIVQLISSPSFSAITWLQQRDPYAPGRAWIAPFLYAAFNLASAQAVLVPLGSSVQDRVAIQRGGILGGIGLGMLLIAGHLLLSSQHVDVVQYEIPMAAVVGTMGIVIYISYLLLIYAEIFSTFVADLFGLSLHFEQRTRLPRQVIVISLLLFCFCFSFIGFKALLSVLYPLFGILSLLWFGMLILHQTQRHPQP